MKIKYNTIFFKTKGHEKHDNQFNYDRVNCINCSTKVEIGCNKCGKWFFQKPYKHLLGRGCPYCIKNKKLNNEEYIKKANIIHPNNKFSYEEMNYIDSNTKIEIGCNICFKWFWQVPSSHLQGHGCPYCAGLAKLNMEEFTNKANVIHPNSKYNYSKSIYVNSFTKIEIGCNVCKEWFWQKPCEHLRGQGCPKCAGNIKYTHEKILQCFNSKHDNQYEYPFLKEEYKNNKTKITIFHKKCNNLFKQRPNDHLTGYGCPYCYRNIKYTNETFIIEANIIHPDNEFEYPNLNYQGAHIKIDIIHKKCGKSFKRNPGSHLLGYKCPFCTKRISKQEIKWLNSLNILEEYRQYTIKINKQWFKVDGYSPETNTIYEFFGDYWHGNPEKFKPEDLNKINKKTFGQLYQETMERIDLLKNNGYNIVYIWENDWKKIKK